MEEKDLKGRLLADRNSNCVGFLSQRDEDDLAAEIVKDNVEFSEESEEESEETIVEGQDEESEEQEDNENKRTYEIE